MTNKDVIITRLLRQNEQLNQQVQLLTEENQKLRDKIARLEKNSSNSSKPPSSDIINPQPPNKRKKKRKFGGQKGHSKHTRPLFEADEITKTIIHKIPDKEVRRRGLIVLEQTESALQQIDLPKQLFDVIDWLSQVSRPYELFDVAIVL